MSHRKHIAPSSTKVPSARAKSLFRNILRIKSLFSIFCGRCSISPLANSNKLRILAQGYQKKLCARYPRVLDLIFRPRSAALARGPYLVCVE